MVREKYRLLDKLRTIRLLKCSYSACDSCRVSINLKENFGKSHH